MYAIRSYYGQEALRVGDGRRHLETVAHDARVVEEPCDAGFGEARDPGRIETGEGPPVAVGTLENGDPGEPRLLAIQAELFKQGPTVIQGAAPLLIVIGNIDRILADPGTALLHPRLHSRFSLYSRQRWGYTLAVSFP